MSKAVVQRSGVRLLLEADFAAEETTGPQGEAQLLAFSPGKEQAAGVWETCLVPGWSTIAL